MVDRQWLSKIDIERLDKPRKARKALEEALCHAAMDLVPEILLVYGATLRQLDQLADARWAYFVGGKLAKQSKNRFLQASFWQRRSWVEFVDGKFSVALGFLRQAAGMFSELGDRNHHGKVLVDMALQYINREMPAEAVPCATSALQELDDGETENRFSAHQVLAVGWKELGDREATLHHLESARQLLGSCGKAAAINFLWMEVRIKKEILPLEAVASAFAEVAEFFLESGEILDSSLASLEFAKCQFLLGKHQKVRQILKSFKKLAFQVEGELAASVLMHVYREGLRSEVSETILCAAIEALEEAAADASRAPAAGGQACDL